MNRKNHVIREETGIIQEHLERNLIEYTQGTATFLDKNKIKITSGKLEKKVSGKYIIIATGTSPNRPPEIPFDDEKIVDSDSLLTWKKMPQKLLVIGAGVVGLEYASILSCVGVDVTLIDPRENILPWMDSEIVNSLKSYFEDRKIKLHLNTKVSKITRNQKNIEVEIGNSKQTFDAVLFCQGRVGNTSELGLENIKIKTQEKGLLNVNSNYQTAISNIYAIGDVIGNPQLASASSEQGRLAIAHAFKKKMGKFPTSFPYGIYTIPEISSVGLTEEELKQKKIPYIVGRANYKEIARGKIIGDEYGLLKMLFHKKTKKLLGVHIIGTGATELIHIGQVVFILGKGVEFFIENVFNYPTLAEAYKIAAYNAYHQINKVRTK
jgi:NAD(P) transhydrogenase